MTRPLAPGTLYPPARRITRRELLTLVGLSLLGWGCIGVSVWGLFG